MKTRVSIFFLFFLLLIPVSSHAAVIMKEGREITFHNASPWYIVDGRWTEGKYNAELTGDVLYVSLDDFGRAFKCYTEYNSNDNSVYVQFSDKSIWQGIGYTHLYIKDEFYENPAPYISGESEAVMVPLEPYASVIGYRGEFEILDSYMPGQMTLKREVIPYTAVSLEVNKAAQLVTVYGKEPSGNIEPVKYMLCSTGVKNSTPGGTFRISPLGKDWFYFAKFKCYVLYCSQITGDVCFHSIPHNEYSFSSMSKAGYTALGTPASHGCVRLLAEDAKFIHENCGGLTVNIINGYTNETTDYIKQRLKESQPSYTNYIQKLQSGGI